MRLLVADRCPVVGEAIGRRMGREPEVEVVGWASDAASTERRARLAPQPDVVLADLGLPDAPPLEIARRLRQCQPDLRVVFMIDRPCPVQAQLARRAGADGLVVKSDCLEGVRQALRAVLAGSSGFADTHAAASRGDGRQIEPTSAALQARLEALSDREHDVLICIARGYRRAAIARQLHIAGPTVAAHIRNLHQKLDARNRLELMRLAVLSGLVPP